MTEIYTVEKKAWLLNFELEFKFNTQSLHEQDVFFFPVAFVFSAETVASSLSCFPYPCYPMAYWGGGKDSPLLSCLQAWLTWTPANRVSSSV